MADLVRELASVMGRPILDKTGFTGEFDLDLSFAPDGTVAGFQSYEAGDPNLPNIVTALQEQFGLKLTPAKGPVEVLVIDHAERPIPN